MERGGGEMPRVSFGVPQGGGQYPLGADSGCQVVNTSLRGAEKEGNISGTLAASEPSS